MLGVGVHIARGGFKRRRQYVIAVQGRENVTPTNGTIVFVAHNDVAVAATGNVTIVSITYSNDALFNGVQLRRHSVVISCANSGTGNLVINDSDKIVALGNHAGGAYPSINFYTGVDASAPRIATSINTFPKNLQKIRQSTAYPNILSITGTGVIPNTLRYLRLHGANVSFSITNNLPPSITYLQLEGVGCALTGPLPANLQILVITGNSINWAVSGLFPHLLTYIIISSNSLNISNIIIEQLTYFILDGSNIYVNSSEPLNSSINHIYLNGSNINWTGSVFGRVVGTPKPNLIALHLANYRNPSNSLAYTELLSMLNSIINNVNAVPPTILIGELPAANVTAIVAAAPNQFGTEPEQCKFLINSIKSTKGVTTFTLNTTNI